MKLLEPVVSAPVNVDGIGVPSEPALGIALVGHGVLSIPPKGWGAVETVIWEYSQQLEKLGHRVSIINCRWTRVARELIKQHRRSPIDWCWVHNEKAITGALLASKICGFKVVATGHSPMEPTGIQARKVRRQFWRLKRAKFHLSLTTEQAFAVGVMSKGARVALQPNGTDVDGIRFSPDAGNLKAAYVGRISLRKRQVLVSELVEGSGAFVDFIGPCDEPMPEASSSCHLGEWGRETLADKLTEYSALVLYSEAEAHPLVVPEALAAGLSVVVSPQSAANLDISRPFVYVVGRDEDLAPAIERAAMENAGHRAEIRAYAEASFGWPARARALVGQFRAWDAEVGKK